MPPALSSLLLFLFSLLIFPIVLTAFTAPDTQVEIFEVLPDDVEVGPIDDFLTACSSSTVTAVEAHVGSNTPW